MYASDKFIELYSFRGVFLSYTMPFSTTILLMDVFSTSAAAFKIISLAFLAARRAEFPATNVARLAWVPTSHGLIEASSLQL
jgi:hypothetical protein